MLSLYQSVMGKSTSLLDGLLARRVRAGKEDETRLDERRGMASMVRPEGPLCWVHAASVGEAQSALILINQILRQTRNMNVLVTTGTLSSARIMQGALPDRAFHQLYPLDHPEWTARFLEHWQPDLVLWMESELWPNMLMQLAERNVPSFLMNARLSPVSYRNWSLLRGSIRRILNSFTMILCQTETDQRYFKKLGADRTEVSGNIKYSAKPLSCDEADLKSVLAAIGTRPSWVFASTHKGEEALATRVHDILHAKLPELLTIIVPRHPERRAEIENTLQASGLGYQMRGEEKVLPSDDADIYIADTFGELGLFYRACPVACIGRSYSDDGGGGHNPIEAAQLGCAVLHGPNVQNLQDVFDEMDGSGAALLCADEGHLAGAILELLSAPETLEKKQRAALDFARAKERVIDRVMPHIQAVLEHIPSLEFQK